jgi:Domain of unknown function DUF11
MRRILPLLFAIVLCTSGIALIGAPAAFALKPPSLTQSASPANFSTSGTVETVSFLVVNNAGTYALKNVAVLDTLLSNVSCPLSTLPSNSSETCQGTLTTTQAEVANGSFTSSALLTGTLDGTAEALTSTLTVNTAMALTESANPASYSAPGTVITFTYVVTNTGTQTLSNVSVTDPLTNPGSCTGSAATPGSSESCIGTYSVTQTDLNNGHLGDTASVTATAPGNLSASATSTASIEASPLSLSETGTNQGYDPTSTSQDLTNVSAPSTADAQAFGNPGDQAANTFYDYSNATATPPPNPQAPTGIGNSFGYVEDAHQLLDFDYIVTNTGSTTLTDVTVTGSLDGSTTCSGLGANDSLAPNEAAQCTGSHVTTTADIQNAESTQQLVDAGTATAQTTQDQPVTPASSSTSFVVPVYGLNTIPGGGEIVAGPCMANNLGDPAACTLYPATPGSGTSQSSIINADLAVLSEDTSPQNTQTPNPSGGLFQGNIAPAAVPVVLDLNGQSYEVDNGTSVPYPGGGTNEPPYPHTNPDTFTYTTNNEADPGESDIWIENGSYTDPSPGPNYNPAINVVLGNNIYVSDVSVVGNDNSGFHGNAVGNAGVYGNGTTNLVLTNFTASHMQGDGINLEPYFCGSGSRPCARSSVTTWNTPQSTQNPTPTESFNGRCGLAPIGTTFDHFDNLVLTSSYLCTIDAEEDSANTQPGSMTFTNLYTTGMVEISAPSVGPMTFNNWTAAPSPSGAAPDTTLWITGGSLSAGPYKGPIKINDSQITCGGYSAGPYGACIEAADVTAPNGTTTCGDSTPWISGDAWPVGNPCSPGLEVNNSSIDITRFVKSQDRSIATGLWNVFNDDCIVDTSPGVKTTGFDINADGNHLTQLTDDGGTFSSGSVCASALANEASGTTVVAADDGSYGPNLTHVQSGTITSPNSATFTVGTAGSFTVQTSDNGGSPAWVPSLVVGDMAIDANTPLPDGLIANDNGGSLTISGTPAADAVSTTVTVIANNGGDNVTQALGITINP